MATTNMRASNKEEINWRFGCNMFIFENEAKAQKVLGTTIWGINAAGDDVSWTTLGDDVRALALCDVDNDGRNEASGGSGGG